MVVADSANMIYVVVILVGFVSLAGKLCSTVDLFVDGDPCLDIE